MNIVIFFLIMIFSAYAVPNEPVVDTLTIEVDREIGVYVAPIKIINTSSQVQLGINDSAMFGMSAMHSKNAKQQGIQLYNKETIKYAWGIDCDYLQDHKKCSNQHNHLLQETTVTVTDDQIIVETLLYNSNMQIIGRGIKSSTSHVVWIKQQETIAQQQQGMMGTLTTIHKLKEELPLKWVIPYRFLENQLNQASLGLWIGVDTQK